MEQAESSESWEYEEVAEMVDVVGEPAKEQSVQTTGGSKVNVACQAVAEELRSCAKVPKRNQKSQTVTEGMDACGSDAAVNAAVSPSEGILRLVISDFKNVTDTVCGPTMEINSLMWRIKAIPKEQVVRKRVEKSLGFYVQCCADGYSENWSCQAAAELTLISQNPGTPNFSKRTNHIYTSKENDWGYSCFMPWAEVIDESQGYFKDGAVILEAVVKAQPPKNILTPAQFRRKVEDYLRLANVQCSRGLLDKAIEVNESALKICKDSDRDLKEALMNQKKELIEKKLKQRIESIEKGPVVEDDCGSTCKQQSLKQAIAGLPKVGKQAAVKLRGHAGVKTEESLIIEKADLDTTSKLQKSNTSVFEKCAKNHTEELSCATSITASSCAHMPVPVPMFCSRHRSHTFSFDSPFSDLSSKEEAKAETFRKKGEGMCRSCPVEHTEKRSPSTPSELGVDEKVSAKRSDKGKSCGDCSSPCEDCVFRSSVLKECFEELGMEHLLSLIAAKPAKSAEKRLESQLDLLNALASLHLENGEESGLRETSSNPVMKADIAKWLAFNIYGYYSHLHLEGKGEALSSYMKWFENFLSAAVGAKYDMGKLMKDSRTSGVLRATTLMVGINSLHVKRVIHNLVSFTESLRTVSNNSAAKDMISLLEKIIRIHESRMPRPSKIAGGTEASSSSERVEPEEIGTVLSCMFSEENKIIGFDNRLAIVECIDLVEAKTADLLNEGDALKKNLESAKDKWKKLLEAMKRMEVTINKNKQKRNKLLEVAREKENACKKSEKKMVRHKSETETLSELQDESDLLEAEDDKICKVDGSALKKVQRELHSNINFQKKMSDEISRIEDELNEAREAADDREADLKRNEAGWASDKKSLQGSVAAGLKRAKKAEVMVLEEKVAIGTRTLNHALKVAEQRIANLENEQKRTHSEAQLRELRNLCGEWKAKRDEIASLISITNAKFEAQVEEINRGKLLEQLPAISIPPPPEAPKSRKSTRFDSAEPESVYFRTPSAGVIGQPRQKMGARSAVSVEEASKLLGTYCPVGSLRKAEERTDGAVRFGIEVSPVWGSAYESGVSQCLPLNSLVEEAADVPGILDSTDFIENRNSCKECNGSLPRPPPEFLSSDAVLNGGQTFKDNQATSTKGCKTSQWLSGERQDVNSDPVRENLLDRLSLRFPEVARETLKQVLDDVLMRLGCTKQPVITFEDILYHISLSVPSKQIWDVSGAGPVAPQLPSDAYAMSPENKTANPSWSSVQMP